MRGSLLFVVIAAGAAFGLVGCDDDGRRPPLRDAGPGTDMGMGDIDTGPPGACVPGTFDCDGNVYSQCAADGMSRENEVVCDAACDPSAGCVACMPGQRRCEGTVSMVCASDGSGFVTARDCAENGASCAPSGFCADDCGAAESSLSNIGCEYWAAPLPNGALNRDLFDYRLVVANPDTVNTANVRVFQGASMISSVTVPPGGLQDIVLPWNETLTPAFEPPMGPSPLDPPPPPDWRSPAVPNAAYRVLADRPVTVTEFNPFEYDAGGGSDFSFTNDASLLLPAHTFTGAYIASSFPTLNVTQMVEDLFMTVAVQTAAPSYVALIGVTPEPTTVTVVANAQIAAASDGRFPAVSRGGVLEFTIQRGEVVVVAAAVPPRCAAGRPGHRVEPATATSNELHFCNELDFDLTGSRITANHPIAAFGGHDCAFVPYDRFACDHLENQLPPLETWGRDFVSGPMGDPGPANRNVVRVTAAFDDTTVTVDPPQGGMGTINLSSGGSAVFDATSPFTVSGSQAIMVSQFLVGQNASEPPADRGDPAMVVLPPREQYRSDYTFVTPSSYNASTMGQSYILVVRTPGQEIQLDGSNISPTWMPAGDREVGIVPLDGGTHQMVATEPFGVIVYGMGQFTSYAYPAGLNLEEILLI